MNSPELGSECLSLGLSAVREARTNMTRDLQIQIMRDKCRVTSVTVVLPLGAEARWFRAVVLKPHNY